jgi:predicted SprT family Zn-dependent metalloprotease
MNLEGIRDMVLSLMKEHGLTGWTFKWANKEVGRFGFCDCTTNTISLSRVMTQHETDMGRIKNTVLHEIAHALDCQKRGYTNHDSEWERIAKSIGCSGTKCGVATGLDKKKFVKWIAQCGHCGKEYFKYYKPKDNLSCSQCDTEYNPEFGLDFKINPDALGKYNPR